MRELDFSFENKNGKFTQIAKSEKAYMYVRIFNGDVFFEVFEKILLENLNIEIYPLEKYFENQSAFSFRIKENAEAKFHELSM